MCFHHPWDFTCKVHIHIVPFQYIHDQFGWNYSTFPEFSQYVHYYSSNLFPLTWPISPNCKYFRDNKYFSFCGSYSLGHSYLLWTESSHRQSANKQVWVCFNKQTSMTVSIKLYLWHVPFRQWLRPKALHHFLQKWNSSVSRMAMKRQNQKPLDPRIRSSF